MKRFITHLILLAGLFSSSHARAGYDPSFQRWIQMDPMVEQPPVISLTPNSAPNSQANFREQANPYLFVLNSPLNYFDPNGLNATTFVDAQGNKFWWGPHDQTPAGYTFQLTPYNQEYKPPGWVWGQDRYGNTTPTPDEQGLQSSFLGDFLLGGVGPALRGGTYRVCPKPYRIYSARELIRRGQESGPYHNFPGSFDDVIFNGQRTVISPSYMQYTQPGSINNVAGIFQIGVRPAASGAEVITHRFFQPTP